MYLVLDLSLKCTLLLNRPK